MPAKWRIFAVANYILLLVYGYLVYSVVEFLIRMEGNRIEIRELLPSWAAILIIFLNSALAIYVFHRHLPARSMSKGLKIAFLVSSVLYTIAVIALLIMIFPAIRNQDPLGRTSFDNFILFFFIGTLLLGGFIIYCQAGVQKYIRTNDKRAMEQLISGIGTEVR